MANINDPDTWSKFPEAIIIKLLQMRELFFDTIEEDPFTIQEEPQEYDF